MESHHVHRLMFYNLEPKAILNISYDGSYLLAVLRKDNVIELWNMKGTPFIQSSVILESQTKLRALVWCKKRLFGADLEGYIKEIDLKKLREKKSYPTTAGGPCHCIAANQDNTHLAVGTELGYVEIYRVTKNDLILDKLIQSERSKILCISWDATGNYLIIGGIEFIRIYNYRDSQVVYHLNPTITKLNKKKKLIVWDIAVTDDLTIFAGDSSGTLSIWDGKKGICVETIKSHKSDILTVCLSNDQQNVFCAGIDPDIKTYVRTKINDKTLKWIQSCVIGNHTHDVHSLIQLNNGIVCSGGADTYLSTATPQLLVQVYPPLLQSPSVNVAADVRYILLRYSTHLELWTLEDLKSNKMVLTVDKPYTKLAEIQSNNNAAIRCASISNDGKWIAYSTNSLIRVFKLSMDSEPKLKVAAVPDCILDNVCHICFSGDSKQLILADSFSTIQVYSLPMKNSNSPSLSYNITIDNKHSAGDLIRSLVSSYDGEYIAIAGCKDQISVWNKQKFLASLPKYEYPATAIAFHPSERTVFAIYSDYSLVEYSLDLKHYTLFSKTFDSGLLVKYLHKRNLPVDNIAFDHDNNDIIILSTSSDICILNKNKVHGKSGNYRSNKKFKLDHDAVYDQNQKSPSKKGQKYNKYEKVSTSVKSFVNKPSNLSKADIATEKGFHVYERYQHLVHVGCIGSKELIAVEIKPKNFIEKLPPLLKSKKFGRK